MAKFTHYYVKEKEDQQKGYKGREGWWGGRYEKNTIFVCKISYLNPLYIEQQVNLILK